MGKPKSSPRNCLIITECSSDLTDMLESCGIETTRMTMEEAVGKDLTGYDAFCVLAYGKILDPRLRVRLEEEAAKGKRVFMEAAQGFLENSSAPPPTPPAAVLSSSSRMIPAIS